MLSILLPIYNYDATPLVTALQQQCEAAKIPYEILLGNDGSTLYLEELSLLTQLPHVRIVAAPKNEGRSKIRNRLGKEAQYPYLIFIDCDALVENPNYIQNYLPYCHPRCCVIGGRDYSKQCTPEYSLCWAYDKERESHNREKHHFTSFQFLIDAQLFREVQFNENITSYGFEDSLFGYEVGLLTPLQFIDNPLTHAGLITNTEYFQKIQKAAQTLLKIYDSPNKDKLMTVSKWARTWNTCKKLHLQKLLSHLFLKKQVQWENRLSQANPPLALLDFYKLTYLCAISL